MSVGLFLVLIAGLSPGPIPGPCSAVRAQAPAPPTTSVDAMKKLDFLLGSWTGAGWIQLGPGKRRNFTQIETVQSKVGGLVVTIDGLGKGSDPDDKGAVVHVAFAVISYEPESKIYRWSAYTADGRSIDAEAKLTGEHVLQWGFAIPQGGNVKYTMDLTEADRWHEVGEFSRDGTHWFKTFEMSLQRSK